MKLATNLFMMLAMFSQSLGPIQLLKPANLQEEKPAISEQIGMALALPTQTPTSTPTPILESPAPSATVAPTETTALGIVLSFKVDPETVKPGEQFVLYWQVEGLEAIKEEAFLRFYAPPGFVLSEDVAAKTDEENGYVDLPVTETSGKLTWSVDLSASLPAMITSEFWQGKEALAKAEVVIRLREEFLVTVSGGEIVGLNDQVRVTFPTDALSETVMVKVGQPSAESLPVESLSGSPFEITAVSESTKAEVSEFSKPVEIQVSYSEAGVTDEANTLLYWYDPTDGEWKLPLSQRIDTENNLIIATTDHFTVFDTYNSNWQSAETPTMEFFQTSAFTGASSFSMPIKVPAGPGGFQPSLSLSYSSSTVDNISSESQSSWAGMGWSLTTSFIERNGHGTNQVMDDSYQLNLNGASMELLPGADGKYHASDENFNKVEFNIPINNDQNMSTWTIWDKSGNQYFFEQRTFFLNLVPCTDGVDFTPYVWRWSLTRVKNIHNQEIIYSHYDDNKGIQYYNCDGDPHSREATIWTYPSEIRYSNNRYRIVFDRIDSTDTNHRLDYKNIWTSGAQYQSYQRALLSAIRIQQDADGDGFEETDPIIRKYVFTYAGANDAHIFPNLVWDAGGKTPTLLSVQEFGLPDANGVSPSLPAYIFEYGDGMHLTKAENGYGGTVEYSYEETPWNETIPFLTGPSDPWKDGIHDYETPAWGNPLRYKFRTSAENWAGIPGYGGVTGGSGGIRVWGMVQNTSVKSYQPGRWYQVVASVRVADAIGTHSIQLGLGYKLTDGTIVDQFSPAFPLPINAYFHTVVSEPIFLPVDATQIIPKMNSTGNNTVDWYYLFPLPTNYRVTARALQAGSNLYTYEYDYPVGAAATNSPVKSVAAAGAHPYVSPYTEFRGHSTVIETDPYGKEITTNFSQSDCLSGRPSSTQVRAGGIILQQATFDYTTPEDTECTESESTLQLYDQDVTTLLGGTLFDPLKYRWVRTASENKDIYSYTEGIHGIKILDGTFFLLTEYGYEPTYGNLTSQTVSGTDIATLTTQIEYYSNTSNGKYIVGLPARTWVGDTASPLAESFTLYNGNGIPTTTRTLMRPGEYSQADVAYDIWGNVTSQTAYSDYWTGSGDGSGAPTGARTMTTVYDSVYHTYPISITNSLGHTTDIDFSGIAIPGTSYTGYTLGVPVSETGPNGAATSVEAEYDAFGRLVKLIRPGDDSASPTLQIAYSNSPFTVTLTQKINSGQSYTVTRVYDGLGRQTQVTAGGVSTNFVYGFDASGARLDKVSVPNSTTFWAETVYDALGRPVKVTAPDGSYSAFSYNGLETRAWDAKGNLTITTTNILGQTLSVNPATGPDLAFDYDDMGDLLTAERGNATVTMEYDLAGRKIGMNDPDMGAWTYDYDALSNLKVQTDARGCTLTMNYDLLNRLDTKTSSGTCGQHVSVNFNYDETTYLYGIGRRTSMTDNSGSSAWEYDERGRLKKETKTITNYPDFITEFTYNSADLPVTMSYPDGEVVTNNYDSRMLLDTVIGNSVYVSDTQYDSAGRMTSRDLGNGLSQKYLYKPWDEQGGRLDMMVAGTGAWDENNLRFATTLQKSDYTYDSVGNITTIADSMWGETQTFGYDSLNRLTSASATDGLADYNETYQYDPATGNLVNKNGLVLNYPTDGTRPHAVTSAGSNTYGYDDNGNQTTRIIGGQTVQLSYDAENRLVTVTGTNLSAQFTYNGDGQRVKSVINGEITLFIGGYYERKGNEITKYYFAGASRIAMRKVIIPHSIALTYFLGDHLGSTSLAVDSVDTTNVIETRYKPWGEVRFTTENLTLPTRYTFTGQYSYVADSATDLAASASFGLMFYNARWYDPQLGRFAQADTIVPGGVQGLDRYAYVNNSPIRYIDPSGHFSDDAIKEYLKNIYGDNWEEIWAKWLGDEDWMTLLHGAEGGDMLSQVSCSSAGNCTMEHFMFTGDGQDSLDGFVSIDNLGQNPNVTGGGDLDGIFSRRGNGIGITRFSKNGAVQIIGTLGNISFTLHQVTEEDTRKGNVIINIAVWGVSVATSQWWIGLGFSALKGWFAPEISALPGMKEGDTELTVGIFNQTGPIDGGITPGIRQGWEFTFRNGSLIQEGGYYYQVYNPHRNY